MIGSTRAVRVFAYTAPVDMRKSYSGLEGLVRGQLGHDPLRGDVHLFTSKDRRKAKVFFFDGVATLALAENERLYAHLEALATENASLRGERAPEQLKIELLRVKEQMMALQRRVFAASSEKRARA